MDLLNSIREIKETDQNQFYEIIKNNFDDKYIFNYPDFIKWQYYPPEYNGEYLSLLVAEIKEKILGYIGFNPVRFNFLGKTVKGRVLSNLMVDQNYRQLGLGPFLVKKNEEESDVIISLAYNRTTNKIFELLNWRHDYILHRYIKILNIENVESLINAKIPFPKKKIVKTASNQLINKLKYFNSDNDFFWNKIKYKYCYTVERNSFYLNWRYCNHPMFNYDIWQISENQNMQGYAITRTEKFDKFKLVRIVDFICDDDYEISLFNFITSHFYDKGYDFIDFFFSGDYHLKSLLTCNYLSDKYPPLNKLPIDYSPLSRERNHIEFAFVVLNKGFIIDNNWMDVRKWYLVKGDGDQDRPNFY
tara:strand:- start:1231 stop:2310 length:1080 start_codon:yes stop_codon:yes gene_type:complete